MPQHRETREPALFDLGDPPPHDLDLMSKLLLFPTGACWTTNVSTEVRVDHRPQRVYTGPHRTHGTAEDVAVYLRSVVLDIVGFHHALAATRNRTALDADLLYAQVRR